ncbi:MAG: flagellar hook-associated protein FlgK [Planctomycetota bacterium]|jgi:flagellar hook-associated protein 1 FlgK
MSFKTLNIGVTALMTSQIGLNTVGHNVSNAATPGYTRQRVMTEAALPDVKSFGVLGSGAALNEVRRVSDEFLEEQVREAFTYFNYLDSQINSYESLEAVFNELTENDMSTTMDEFWSSIGDVNNHVEDVSTRRGLIEKGKVLADTFNNFDQKIYDMRVRMNGNVRDTVNTINQLTAEIARLNEDIVAAEQGGLSNAVANDSRDQRGERLKELAGIIDINIEEESNGQVIVSLTGRLLVFENQSYTMTTEQQNSDDVLIDVPVFSQDFEEIIPGEGQLGAFIDIRDTVLQSYKDDLDTMASNFLFEFNRIHSQGQGLTGYSSITSTTTVIDETQLLNNLTYEFTPKTDTFEIENGNFELKVHNEITSTVDTMNIEIDLDGTGKPDTRLHDNSVDQYDSLNNFSLSGLNYGVNTDTNGELYWRVTAIAGPNYLVEGFNNTAMAAGDRVAFGSIATTSGAVTLAQDNASGISGTVDLSYSFDDAAIVNEDHFEQSLVNKIDRALEGSYPGQFTVSIDNSNRISIVANNTDYTVGFGRDTSGVLATLGLNNFFSGYDGGTIAVNSLIEANPQLVACSKTFEVGDNSNCVDLLKLRDTNILTNDSATVDDYYQGIVGRLGVEFSQKKSLLETQEDILMRAENQREDLSGVNIDEELTKMVQFQRSFQSAAKFISMADTLYETLINM